MRDDLPLGDARPAQQVNGIILKIRGVIDSTIGIPIPVNAKEHRGRSVIVHDEQDIAPAVSRAKINRDTGLAHWIDIRLETDTLGKKFQKRSGFFDGRFRRRYQSVILCGTYASVEILQCHR